MTRTLTHLAYALLTTLTLLASSALAQSDGDAMQGDAMDKEADAMQGDAMDKEGDAMEKDGDAMKKETEEDPSVGVIALLVAFIGGLAIARRFA